MIAKLEGKVEILSDYVIMNVSGVGYKVNISDNTRNSLTNDTECSLFIYTYVREDAINLFGFATRLEQQVFETMLNVSKVGPKLALAVLSNLSAEKVIAAIINSESKALSKVPGIGKKTAERIILELKDRMQHWQDMQIALADTEVSSDITDGQPAMEAVGALVGLGYSMREAEDAIRTGLRKDPEADVETLLKSALKHLYPVEGA